MEYLMTYGWSILIIAVVLGIMFQLGVFNGQSFAPKAPSGSCKVVRLGRPGAQTTSLAGVCNNELPQYIGQFNGQSSYVDAPAASGPTGPFTVSAWVNFPTGWQGNNYAAVVSQGSTWSYQDAAFSLYFGGSGYCGIVFRIECTGGTGSDCAPSGSNTATVSFWTSISFPAGWQHYVGVFDGSRLLVYMNGTKKGTNNIQGSIVLHTSTNHVQIQGNSAGWSGISELISNVQIYNTALDDGQVKALYAEGIGGVPINTQNVIVWWPLNGNANDYSGNNNNGVPTNVLFTSAYTYP
jgi:hypothetical protein